MFGRMDQDNSVSAASYRQAKDVVFLHLRDTVFCTVCELISYNHSPRCLACGSVAVLNLSRVLGGSLRGEETARVVKTAGAEIEASRPLGMRKAVASWSPEREPAYAVAMQAQSAMAEQASTPVSMLQFGVDRTRGLTGASGAAIAMREGERMVCRARAGNTAPEIGSEVPPEGLTALCARTGQMWRCNDTEHEPWVNRDCCRRLGIRSIVVAPVLAMRSVLGILEVFSPKPAAFNDQKAATVQLMASAIALASLRPGRPLTAMADGASASNLQLEQ